MNPFREDFDPSKFPSKDDPSRHQDTEDPGCRRFETVKMRSFLQPEVVVHSLPPMTGAGASFGGGDASGEDMSLCLGQLKNTSGFIVKYLIGPCSPDFMVRPLGRAGGLPVPLGSALRGASLRTVCSCPCSSAEAKWQTISFGRNGLELFNFLYKPSVWTLGSLRRTVSVHVPERNEMIGLISIGENGISAGAEIEDSVNNLKFTTRRVVNDLTETMEVVDGMGKAIAVANLTRGLRDDDIEPTHFQITFSDEMIRGSGYRKALCLSSVCMWAIEKQEKVVKHSIYIIVGVLFLCSLLLIVVASR